ncbi:putative toxin-antitoxin system toxin component, PIN family [Thiococcus pfennigii]|uniref:putative toxin-antitoxin system toxin component, PIN family n=1 Tax=Thiococcus pfennigii TaxID=1057 RepID=UPI0019066AE9|nr:putative toxin-antitoxin system toxin component, PIN family [Thiococcus pfennigii]MBK1730782.1 putative toxin-antitoxin system toxin component, PIN family [Thiococcus pfennigii]
MTSPSSRPPRVVLDTNLVLAALVFGGGVPGAFRTAWQQDRFQPLIARPTLAELLRVLAYPKFRLAPAEQRELLADYLPWCETVQIPVPSPATPTCRGPFDKPFLELAVAGKAGFLVTGDQDLLALAAEFPLPIVTPNRFLADLAPPA